MYRSYMDTSISFHKHQKYNSKQMTFIRRFNLGLIFVIYFRKCGARVKTPVSRSSEISTVRIFNYKALTLLYITFKFPRICSLFKAIQIIIAQRREVQKKCTRDDRYKLF